MNQATLHNIIVTSDYFDSLARFLKPSEVLRIGQICKKWDKTPWFLTYIKSASPQEICKIPMVELKKVIRICVVRQGPVPLQISQLFSKLHSGSEYTRLVELRKWQLFQGQLEPSKLPEIIKKDLRWKATDFADSYLEVVVKKEAKDPKKTLSVSKLVGWYGITQAQKDSLSIKKSLEERKESLKKKMKEAINHALAHKHIPNHPSIIGVVKTLAMIDSKGIAKHVADAFSDDQKKEIYKLFARAFAENENFVTAEYFAGLSASSKEELYVEYARSRVKRGYYKEAQAFINKVGKHTLIDYTQFSILAAERGDYTQASAYAKKANFFCDVMTSCAEIAAEWGDYQAAQQFLHQAKSEQGHIVCALAAAKRGDFDKAVKLARFRNRVLYDALAGCAEMAAICGHYQKAKEMITKITHPKTRHSVYMNCVEIAKQRGDVF